LIGAILLTHQFKKDPDYVSLIAGKKRKAGIGLARHFEHLRPKNSSSSAPLSDVQDRGALEMKHFECQNATSTSDMN